MPRGLDHIVHAVRDLDAAAELYRGLGFTVGARNRHPRAWGTQNHIVQLPGTFIELLTVADAGRDRAARAAALFVRRLQPRFPRARRRACRCSCSKGAARPTPTEFRRSGIGDFELYEFEREGKRPDGTPVKVGFSLAFARDPARARHPASSPASSIIPENFWNPAFQKHANGATAVAGVVAVADEPERVTAISCRPSPARTSSRDTGDGFRDRHAARGDRGDRRRLPSCAASASGARCLARRTAGGDALCGRGREPAAGYAASLPESPALYAETPP